MEIMRRYVTDFLP